MQQKYFKSYGQGVGSKIYCVNLLKIIKTTRLNFINDVQQGAETLIPNILQQTKLPQSFQYYDPIQLYIKEGMDDQ